MLSVCIVHVTTKTAKINIQVVKYYEILYNQYENQVTMIRSWQDVYTHHSDSALCLHIAIVHSFSLLNNILVYLCIVTIDNVVVSCLGILQILNLWALWDTDTSPITYIFRGMCTHVFLDTRKNSWMVEYANNQQYKIMSNLLSKVIRTI